MDKASPIPHHSIGVAAKRKQVAQPRGQGLIIAIDKTIDGIAGDQRHAEQKSKTRSVMLSGFWQEPLRNGQMLLALAQRSMKSP